MLAAVLLVAAALRFYGLDGQSLWNDELNTWGETQAASSGEVIARVYEGGIGVHPPGYFLLIYYSQMLLGDGEWALRLPSAIAGTLAVGAIYALGRKLYGPWTGVLAAAMLAVMRTPIERAQEARMYSFVLLFAILTALFMASVVRDMSVGGRGRINLRAIPAVGYVLCYTHYFGVYLVGMELAALGAFALTRRDRGHSVGGAALLGVSVLLVYSPWVSRFAERYFMGSQQIKFIDRPGGLAEEFWSFLRGIFGSSDLLAAVMACLYVVLLAGLLLAVKTGLSPERRADGWLLGWLFVPFLGAYAISLVGTPVLVDRYLLVILPAAYLLAARAMTSLPIDPVISFTVFGTFIVALAGYLVVGADFYEPRRTELREASEWAMQRGGEGSTYGYCAGVRIEYMNYYGRSGKGYTERVCDGGDFRKLAQEVGPDERVYVVLTRNPKLLTGLDELERNFVVQERENFRGVDALQIQRRVSL